MTSEQHEGEHEAMTLFDPDPYDYAQPGTAPVPRPAPRPSRCVRCGSRSGT
jgi:hypothetical protein